MDRAGLNAKAEVELSVKPYEQIFIQMESGGSRADWRKSQGIEEPEEQRALPALEDVEDAEVIEDWLEPIPPDEPETTLSVDLGAKTPDPAMSFDAAVSAAAAMNRQRALPSGR